MPTITHLLQQKDKNRVNVYLDGKFVFGISLESLLANKLKVGQSLSTRQVDRLRKESNEGKIYAGVVRFATMRPRSQKEVEDWFRRKKIDKSVQQKVFNRLNKLGLVDDADFARWWVEQRTTFRPLSRRAIAFELTKKGVDRQIVNEALQSVEVPQELELAKAVLGKKFKNIAVLSNEQLQKVYAFLGRKGFSWETIKRSVDEVRQKEVKL